MFRVGHSPAKQKARVQRSLDRILAFSQHDSVNSMTFIGGPKNSLMFSRPKTYDEAMAEHFTNVATAGLNVIDPMPLLAEVDKFDDYHIAYTESNQSVCVNWFRALCIETPELLLKIKLPQSLVGLSRIQLLNADITPKNIPEDQRRTRLAVLSVVGPSTSHILVLECFYHEDIGSNSYHLFPVHDYIPQWQKSVSAGWGLFNIRERMGFFPRP